MPIERRDSTAQLRAILIGVVALIFVGTLGYATFRAASGDGAGVVTDPGSNSERFNAGPVERLAEIIAEDGPVLHGDPSGDQDRPIYISHIGNDDESGWYSFVAKPMDSPDDCFVNWDLDAEVFVSDCTDETFDATGDGLEQLANEITDGDLIVDVKGTGETDGADDPENSDPDEDSNNQGNGNGNNNGDNAGDESGDDTDASNNNGNNNGGTGNGTNNSGTNNGNNNGNS